MGNGSVIYLDVLFANELMMNSLVLVLYCGISRKKYKRSIWFLAVLLSSVFGVLGIVFACGFPWWNGCCSLALSCGTAFLELFVLQYAPGRKIRQIFLEVPAMIFSAFLLAGSLFAGVSGSMIFGQRQTLDRVPLWSTEKLGLAAGICVIFLTAGIALIQIRSAGQKQGNLKKVWITLNGETYTVTAITDTGNNLYDKKSGRPVHIVEESSFLKKGQKEQLLQKEPERITFVSYSSLGNPGGVLMVVQAQELVIWDCGRKIKLRNQNLGLTDQKLSSSGAWQMLLHPDLEACSCEKGGPI